MQDNESIIIKKLYHNKVLRDNWLHIIKPVLFAKSITKVQFAIIKEMHLAGAITMDFKSLKLFTETNPKLIKLLSDNKLTSDMLSPGMFNTATSVIKSADMFEMFYKTLCDDAYKRFINNMTAKIKEVTHKGDLLKARDIIEATAKGYGLIYNEKKNTNKKLSDSIKHINSSNKLIKTFSNDLNKLIGGFTRGYPVSIIGRSGHCKSTMFTFDITDGILSGRIKSADIISCEESASSIWQRIISNILNMDLEDIRKGIIEITEDDVAEVEKLLDGRLNIYDSYTSYDEVIELLHSLSSEVILIDHINSINYPGGSDAVKNMAGGIPNLINQEKIWLKKNSDSIVINFSQVGEKDMMKRGKKFPSYSDAYCSSVLHQASREFLSVYYPCRDNVELSEENEPRDLVRVSVEKNSFGITGIVNVKYEREYARFKNINKEDIVCTSSS